METAISLPDQVYYEAEETAKNLGISRSALYVNALVDYLEKNNRKSITQKLNEVYTGDYYTEFEPIASAGLESIRELTKNDSWWNLNVRLADAPGNVLIKKKDTKLNTDSVIIVAQLYAIDRSRLREKIAKNQNPKIVPWKKP